MTDQPNQTGGGDPADDAQSADGPERTDLDTRAWSVTLLVIAGFAAFSALWALALGEGALRVVNGAEYGGRALQSDFWLGGDLWPPIRAANTMLAGSPLAPYTMNPLFVAMPGYAFVNLPLSALMLLFDIPPPAFRIGGGEEVVTRSPIAAIFTVWAVLWAIPFAKIVRSLAWELGVRKRLTALQIVTLTLGFFPMVVIYGHLEDALVVTLVLFAIVQCKRHHWTNVAICLTFALSLKQTTALVVPMFFVFVPKQQRLRFTAITVSLPVLLLVGVFATDFNSAFRSLLRPPTTPTNPFGRQAWFLASNEAFINAGPYRLGAPLLALAFAASLRHNRDIALFTAGVGMAFLARLPFEAVSYMYYLSPVLVVAAIYETRRNGNAMFATVFGFPALALFWWEASKAWWFWPIDATLFALAIWPMLFDFARRHVTNTENNGSGLDTTKGPSDTTPNHVGSPSKGLIIDRTHQSHEEIP